MDELFNSDQQVARLETFPPETSGSVAGPKITLAADQQLMSQEIPEALALRY